MARGTPGILFLPSFIETEVVILYLILGSYLAILGGLFFYYSTWLLPALLIMTMGINLILRLVAYSLPVSYYNKLAFSIGNTGSYVGSVAGFYLGSLFPGIGNIAGALFGLIVGLVMGPLLSVAMANLLDRLGWAEPVGIVYAEHGSTLGWWLGAIVGLGIGSYIPVGPVLGCVIGMVAGSSLLALSQGIWAHHFDKADYVDIDGRRTIFNETLYAGGLPSRDMRNKMYQTVMEKNNSLISFPQQHYASERIVDVSYYHKNIVPPDQIKRGGPAHKFFYSRFNNPWLCNSTELFEEGIIIEMPDLFEERAIIQIPGAEKSEYLFTYSIEPKARAVDRDKLIESRLTVANITKRKTSFAGYRRNTRY